MQIQLCCGNNMSAREKLEQIKREREQRLALQAAELHENSSTNKPTLKHGNKKTGIASTKGSINSNDGGPLLTWQTHPPSPLLTTATPAPPLSVKDLSLSGSRNNEKPSGESVLASYWDRNDISAADNCNSYTSIAYEERGGLDDSPGFMGGVHPRYEEKAIPSPSLNSWQESKTDVVATFRKRSEAALRASLDSSLDLNLRRLNAPVASSQVSLSGSIGNFNGQRIIGFDTDGLLEPDEDSTCLSVSQYSTANNINNNTSGRRKNVQKSNDSSRPVEDKQKMPDRAPFARHVARNANNNQPKSKTDNNVQCYNNNGSVVTWRVQEETLRGGVYLSVEGRLGRLDSIWRNIGDKRIKDFIAQYGGL